MALFMTRRILITGALGHIGSGLIRNLGKNVSKDVIILDNLESRRYPSLFGLPGEFKFKFIRDDLKTADFAKYLSGVDIVIHLANTNLNEDGQKFSRRIETANFLKLKKVADACLTKKVKLFFPSTTSVYGSQTSIVDEACKEIRPQSPHAQSKLASERYLEKLGRLGLKYVICRFGTIYGYSPGMRYDTAVNKFIWQAATSEPLTVWKTAWKQKRPYLYLGDCIRAINFIIEKDLFDRQIYNVISDNHTVQEVIKTIKRATPDLKITFIDSPIMNQLSYEVSDKKLQSLGFKPLGNLNSGIKETIKQLEGIIQTPR